MCICSYHSWKYNITYLKGYRKKKRETKKKTGISMMIIKFINLNNYEYF